MQTLVPARLELGPEHELAELADGERGDRLECSGVVGALDECAHIVVDELGGHDVAKCHLREHELGRHALALGAGGDPGELITRLDLVGASHDLAQIGEGEGLTAQRGAQIHAPTRSAGMSGSVMSVANRCGSPATKSRHSGYPST